MINQIFLFLSAGSIMTLALTQTLTDMTSYDCLVKQIPMACATHYSK
nr:hypothetical protein [uncultured Mediterranean phage uvMED]BAR20672.1 hypothetical protein [uncultured Mediterranean phage uvMED]